jgi:Dolichyl-phosphate-mannose-protein mannosyltransferase
MLIWGHLRCQEKRFEASGPMISIPVSTRSVGHKSEARTRSEPSYELWTVLAALTLLYVVAMLEGNRRFVWFDELYTLDIARARTIPLLWRLIARFDFQPPAGYLFSRFSMELFGQNPFGLRFPSMLEFYVGSMALFFFVRRKVGISYATAAVLILWLGGTFRYATEARPYALLMMSFSTLLLCWDIATTSEKRRLALWGVAISNLGMLSAHIFAPLSLFPFLAAELVRFSRTRKADFALWAALLLPTAAMILYIPLLRGSGALYFPAAFQASAGKIVYFYFGAISIISVALFVAVCAALIMPQGKPWIGPVRSRRTEEMVLLGLILLNPILLNIVLSWRHGAFWDRYVITTTAVIYIGIAILLGLRLARNRYAGYAAAAILLVFCVRTDVWKTSSFFAVKDASALADVRSDLPLVDAGGVTFFEMNHHEKPDVLSRLYFLKDRSLAMSYTHTNIFEDHGWGDGMKPDYPISASVRSYTDFIHQHREFLVLGTYDAPEEWVLRKLHDDGARLTWLGAYPLPYVDYNLYLVTLTAAK